MPDDNELRDRFAALRREDQAQAGEYHAFVLRTRTRAKRRRFTRWVAVPAVVALAIAAAVIALKQPPGKNTGSQELSIMDWRSSTDFLLSTPGQEVLQSVPRIGEWPISNRPRRGNPKTPVIKKKGLTKLFLKESLT
jgi:hypothetical protein